MVLMRHPKLPDQVYDAQEVQVPGMQWSGWEVIPEEDPPGDGPPPTTEDQDAKAPADAGAFSLPDSGDTPSQRRRASKEGAE